MTVYVYTEDPINEFRGDNSINKEQDFQLYGYPGKKLTGESGRSGLPATTVIVSKDGNYYTLHASDGIFEAALSTFKFTN